MSIYPGYKRKAPLISSGLSAGTSGGGDVSGGPALTVIPGGSGSDPTVTSLSTVGGRPQSKRTAKSARKMEEALIAIAERMSTDHATSVQLDSQVKEIKDNPKAAFCQWMCTEIGPFNDHEFIGFQNEAMQVVLKWKNARLGPHPYREPQLTQTHHQASPQIHQRVQPQPRTPSIPPRQVFGHRTASASASAPSQHEPMFSEQYRRGYSYGDDISTNIRGVGGASDVNMGSSSALSGRAGLGVNTEFVSNTGELSRFNVTTASFEDFVTAQTNAGINVNITEVGFNTGLYSPLNTPVTTPAKTQH